jgi:hypothetical protein
LQAVDFIYLPPLSPFQTGLKIGQIFIMFEKGREFERGLHPLSSKLPSLAINNCGLLPVSPAGEGIKG